MRYFWALLVALLSSPYASADTLVTCGPAKGYSYYFPGGAVPEQSAGWSEDGMSSGKTALTVDTNGEYDVLFIDGTGKIKGSKSDGAEVFPLSIDLNSGTFLIFVAYPGNGIAETYLFELDASGKGTLVQSAAKATNVMSKAHLMASECTRGDR